MKANVHLVLFSDGRARVRLGRKAELGPSLIASDQYAAGVGASAEIPDTGWDPRAERILGEPPRPPDEYVPVLPVTRGRFLTPLFLQVLDYRDPSGRQLFIPTRPFGYWSELLQREIWVQVGVMMDGESIPLNARSVAGYDSLRAGLIHDDWYGSHWIDDRDLADQVYREVLLTDGVHVVDADKKYAAVSAWGRRAWASGPARRRILAVA